MKSIALLSVLCLSGCSTTADKLDREYESKRAERRLERIEDAIDRLIKAQTITSDAIDFAIKQLEDIVHQYDKPIDRINGFDI